MKRFLAALMVCSTLPLAAPTAWAQDFPNRPIRVVLPYSPGGGTDNLIRALVPIASNELGQQLVVENKPGGSTLIGTDIVAKAAPDGYTVLATDTAVLTNPGLQPQLPFDTLKDLTGVTMLASAPVLLVTHPSVPAKNLKELLALARAEPGKLNYASGGNGTSTHLAGELLKLAAGVNITHVPYKGTAPAMNDLLGGQVQMQFAGISTAAQHVAAGRLRAIAVTGSVRNVAMPEVPTFLEQGVRGVDADTYWGIYAPAGTPAEVLQKLSAAFGKAVRSPELADRLAKLGYIPIGNSPQQHTVQMREMIERWKEVIRKANIKLG